VAIAIAWLVVACSPARAGMNSGGLAHLYWQTGTAGFGKIERDDTTRTPQLVVTLTGINNFRGADIQIYYWALNDSRTVPAAWQFQLGGCAAAAAQFTVGGFGGSYPNIFTTSPAVPQVAVLQNEAIYNTADCVTPHGSGLLWLQAAGTAGVARNSTAEYAAWAIRFDLGAPDGSTGHSCAGGYFDPSGGGICLYPTWRLPCGNALRVGVAGILDGNLDEDFLPFETGRLQLTWRAGSRLDGCYNQTPARNRTWGLIRRLYQ
jgi:hypothetical protein